MVVCVAIGRCVMAIGRCVMAMGKGVAVLGFGTDLAVFLADGPTCGEVSISGVLWPEFCGHKKFFGDLLVFEHFFFFIKRCVAGFGGCVCVSAKCQM